MHSCCSLHRLPLEHRPVVRLVDHVGPRLRGPHVHEALATDVKLEALIRLLPVAVGEALRHGLGEHPLARRRHPVGLVVVAALVRERHVAQPVRAALRPWDHVVDGLHEDVGRSDVALRSHLRSADVAIIELVIAQDRHDTLLSKWWVGLELNQDCPGDNAFTERQSDHAHPTRLLLLPRLSYLKLMYPYRRRPVDDGDAVAVAAWTSPVFQAALLLERHEAARTAAHWTKITHVVHRIWRTGSELNRRTPT